RDRPVEMPVTTVGPGVLDQIVLDVQGAPGDRLLHLGEYPIGCLAEVEGQLPDLAAVETDCHPVTSSTRSRVAVRNVAGSTDFTRNERPVFVGSTESRTVTLSPTRTAATATGRWTSDVNNVQLWVPASGVDGHGLRDWRLHFPSYTVTDGVVTVPSGFVTGSPDRDTRHRSTMRRSAARRPRAVTPRALMRASQPLRPHPRTSGPASGGSAPVPPSERQRHQRPGRAARSNRRFAPRSSPPRTHNHPRRGPALRPP